MTSVAPPRRVVVISACTGAKAVHHPRALTREHLLHPPPDRVAELAPLATPAAELYTGLQHVRLLRGVERLQHHDGFALEVWILSAGYGLVPADRPLLPYDCSFAGMGRADLRAWADALGVPGAVRAALAEPYDLGLLLLGQSYLAACGLDADVRLGGPTLAFCGGAAAAGLAPIPGVRPIIVANPAARRFRCGLVGLKGELGARVLEHLADEPGSLDAFTSPSAPILDLLDPPEEPAARPRVRPVDRVVTLPTGWDPGRRKLLYFIPEWDDRVDRDYDFLTDTHSSGRGDWSNEVYAHQLLEAVGPAYDGILISKVVAERNAKKKRRINDLLVHRYLRVPRGFPVMGDCGAFGYIDDDDPPYETGEILDYYTRLGFDIGVSIDHLIVKATMDRRDHRYGLTLANAEAFLAEHRARGLDWTPMAAVQGWSPATYARAAQACAAMGYTWLGLGGLVRSRTPEVLRIVQAVRDAIPSHVRLHLFGVARADALGRFVELGVTSFDSASYLRRAWLGARDNYHTADTDYCALRIPEAGRSFRAKRAVSDGRVTEAALRDLEVRCLDLVRRYDRDAADIDDVMDALTTYDALISDNRRHAKHDLRRTLVDRPWRRCPCPICVEAGVDVVIFRGNNRNRRRGFHNTWVFWNKLERALGDR